MHLYLSVLKFQCTEVLRTEGRTLAKKFCFCLLIHVYTYLVYFSYFTTFAVRRTYRQTDIQEDRQIGRQTDGRTDIGSVVLFLLPDEEYTIVFEIIRTTEVKSSDKYLKTIFYNFLFYYFNSIGNKLFINVIYNFLLLPLFAVLARFFFHF